MNKPLASACGAVLAAMAMQAAQAADTFSAPPTLQLAGARDAGRSLTRPGIYCAATLLPLAL